MRLKFLILHVLAFGMASAQQGVQTNSAPGAAGKAEKIRMLQRACANGALTKEECAAKMAAIQGGSTPSKNAAAAGSDVIYSNSPEPPKEPSPDINPQNRMKPEQATQSLVPTSYRDPGGRFSITVPAGWKSQPVGKNGEDGIRISNGLSWARIGPYGGVHDNVDLVNNLAEEYRSEYQDYSMGDHGSLKVNGHDASYAAFSGVNSKGEHMGMRYGGVSAGRGRFLAVAAFIPHNQIEDVDPQIKDMFMSISFGQ